jgi:3-hydroxyacyl-[acyl-carrier-protein] dehydratase
MSWLNKETFDLKDILEVLPHRYPFLLVDRVLEVKTSVPLRLGMTEKQINDARKGSFARTIKNVTFNEPHFQGHFPENPIFPGVLTLEAMAQSAAFVTIPFVVAANSGKLPPISVALAGFDRVRFRKAIIPGDQMQITVTATQVKGLIWAFDGVVNVDGKKAAEGSFMAQLSVEKGNL